MIRKKGGAWVVLQGTKRPTVELFMREGAIFLGEEVVAVLEPSVQRINPWSALYRVLTDPWTTFQRLGEKPPILPSYLAQMIGSLVAAIATIPLTLQVVTDQLAAMPPDQVPAGFAGMMRNFAIGGAVVQAAVMPWLAGLVIALVATFMAQFTGARVGFRAYFGMVGYARVPLVINSIIQGLLLTRASTLSEAMNMSLSLAAFLPTDSNIFVSSLLSLVNPFSIWYYVLLAFGFAALHQTPPKKGWTFAGAILALNVIGTVINAVIGSAAM